MSNYSSVATGNSTRTRSTRAAVVGGAALVAALSLWTRPAHATVTLFTTTSDFTAWTGGNGATATASTAYDSDGSTTNGAGNNPGNSGSSLNAGGTSPGGSLAITGSGTLANGYTTIASSPGEAYNPSFMAAIDPGSTTAYTAANNYGPGATVAYSGTMYITSTVPPDSGSGTFYELGVDLSYDGDSGYSQFVPTSAVPGPTTVDGQPTITEAIPYTITAGGSLSYFSLNIFTNSNYTPTGTFYLDNIQVSSVPEPASLGLIAGLGLLGLRRRQRD